MSQESLLDQFRQIVGPDRVGTGKLDSEVYSYDASLAGGAPDVVVSPGSTAETAAVICAAADAGVPCTPRGFGTNLSGGSVALDGGVVVCLSRLNRILAIQPERRGAVVQPGVTNLELQDALATQGHFFAPDPASQKVATLGGNVGENSGGPHCLKYGVTTNHILGMTVVLPGGDVQHFGGPAFDPPGYDLRAVMVGSEGTLGIVTELTVRILPKPESAVTLLAVYDSLADAARSVSNIIAEGIVPATLEMMDAPVMRAVEESFPCGYPLDAAAVLIIEVEGPAAGLRPQAESIQGLCTANGCRSIREAKDAAERDQLWAGRRGAFGAIARLAPNYLVADCTVPRTKLPEALERVAAVSKSYGFESGNVFHAGDGNLHPLLFFDARDEDQLHRVHKAGHDIIRACVELGGTITGEHGVGVEKIEEMRMIFSDADLSFQQDLKRVFDPKGLLNPGKAVPKCEPVEPKPPSTDLPDSLRPADAAEACDMVRAALAGQTPLLPVGSGRRAGCEPPLVPLHSERLSEVIEYDPANQVVTLGAGTTFAAAQDLLGGENQWIPLRPPLASGCTLGGIAALAACGPERLTYGAPRDLLLGLRFVSGKGEHIKAGGRVVKNVAGYDVTRLLVGSAGTLGFLTELTFRVALIPEVCRVVQAHGSLDQCATVAAELLRSSLQPAYVTAAADGPAWELKAGFEGLAVTVQSQTEGCLTLIQDSGMGEASTCDYPAREGIHADCLDSLFESEFLLRADLPLDVASSFAGHINQSAALVDFGCGRIHAGLASLSDDRWSLLCSRAREASGHAVLERAPPDFRQRNSPIGPSRPEWELMHRIKQALDPYGVFASGRVLGFCETQMRKT